MLLLATAITWSVIIDNVYEMVGVLSGQQYPTSTFLHSLERYLHGSLAVLIMFYMGLWTIKINFLLFFRGLGDQVKSFYWLYWWAVSVFTIAAGAVCIGTVQYQCLAVSTTESMAKCSGADAIRFQDVTLKVNCGLDVLTDALSTFSPQSNDEVAVANIRKFYRCQFRCFGESA
jgi:hypothetical protein